LLGRTLTLNAENCPLCRSDHAASPCSHYYTTTFEKLFRMLIDGDADVRETHRAATWADACCFEIQF
jgi:bacteriochlorophyll 4-vinyl reductase